MSLLSILINLLQKKLFPVYVNALVFVRSNTAF